jgi:hypothetical protein
MVTEAVTGRPFVNVISIERSVERSKFQTSNEKSGLLYSRLICCLTTVFAGESWTGRSWLEFLFQPPGKVA